MTTKNLFDIVYSKALTSLSENAPISQNTISGLPPETLKALANLSPEQLELLHRQAKESSKTMSTTTNPVSSQTTTNTTQRPNLSASNVQTPYISPKI